MTDRYHYTQCGLDYVYLENGFRLEETPYGAGVSIEDADELHEAIALSIITSPHAIRGQELRFLRAMLEDKEVIQVETVATAGLTEN